MPAVYDLQQAPIQQEFTPMPNRPDCLARLERAGITPDDAVALRRISMTLHRWHELECGTGTGQTSHSVQRDETTGKPFQRVQYPSPAGWVDRSWPVADRELGALKRLAALMTRYPALRAYVQSDPRGCALYILRPGDVPEGEDASAHYNHGIAVYK